MAPLLRAAVLHAGTNEPLELIPAVIHAVEEFNRENAILDEDYESAVNHAKVFSDWLWGVFKNKWGRLSSSFEWGMRKSQGNPISVTKNSSWVQQRI